MAQQLRSGSFEQIELQAKLLNYFLGSNKSNINQTRQMFFINKDGDGMSIQMMHQHNARVAARQISGSTDKVYLMYALITCQMWWQVSRFDGKDVRFKIWRVGKTCIYVVVPTTCACVRACVCVRVCVHRNVSGS